MCQVLSRTCNCCEKAELEQASAFLYLWLFEAYCAKALLLNPHAVIVSRSDDKELRDYLDMSKGGLAMMQGRA